MAKQKNEFKTILRSAGRVVIPHKIRKAEKMNEGDPLIVRVEKV